MSKPIKITLITLLVVVIIIGVVFTLFFSSFGNDGLSKKEIFKLVLNNEQLLNNSASEIYALGYNELYIAKETKDEKGNKINYPYISIEGNLKKDKLENKLLLKTLKIKGLIEITKYDSRIEYYCGGFGFGGETSYVGFYYSPDDPAYNMMDNYEFEKVEAGYKWQEKDGDNTYYTEKITDNFYYYEMSF